MSIRFAALRAAACCALLVTTAAHALDTPATDYNKRLKIWQTVSPAGETPFGEQINLYTGELSFSQTDFSFPGTGPEFGVTRFTVTSLEDVSQEPGACRGCGDGADVYAAAVLRSNGWPISKRRSCGSIGRRPTSL